jgi:hypothetical protein
VSARDVVLERNQALRLALGDLQHLITLLAYLAASGRRSRRRGAGCFHREWQEQLGRVEQRFRTPCWHLRRIPTQRCCPQILGLLGRAGHGLANAFGTFGEAFDASPVGRAARRLRDG